MMNQVVTKEIILVMLFVTSLMHGRGQEEFTPPPPSLYEVYFRNLSPEEQVAEYLRQSEEYYIDIEPQESVIASQILSHESGIEAMPYLRQAYDRLEYEYCPNNQWTSLCSEAPMNLLRLIAGMVWLTGFPQNQGVILRPSDEDIAWFVEEAQAKIRRYVATYQLFDGMLPVEQAILDMTDREAALAFRNDDPIRSFYNKYIRGNPELEATIGLPVDLVFEGFEGLVLEPRPPVLAAP